MTTLPTADEVEVTEVDDGAEMTKRNSAPSVVGVLSVVVEDDVEGDLCEVSIGGRGPPPRRTTVDVVTGRTGGDGAADGVVVVTSIGDGVLMLEGAPPSSLSAAVLSSKTSSSPKGEEEELDPSSMSVATPPFLPK